MKEGVDVINLKKKKKEICRFPGDSLVKNPPANAGSKGLIPDPGMSHMSQSTNREKKLSHIHSAFPLPLLKEK